MTKHEELKDAREWIYDMNETAVIFDGLDLDRVAEIAVAYHRHRLETAWVSVKERLPAYDGDQIVLTNTKFVTELLYTEFYGWDGGGTNGNYWNEKVTHWQPLPEPPKEMK